ncbi:hypothetical protein AGMMS49546_25480 [Spirochaetia bacterium]|nr:hypothetical protein AGMMS49546_25480 [Spirochaetia bacterium]
MSDMLAKIRELALKAADFVKSLLEKLSQVNLSALIPQGLLQKLHVPATLKKFIPSGRMKFLFFGLVAALFILIICFIAAVSGMNRRPAGPVKGTSPLSRAVQPLAIPPEELFLPEEPDFVPGPIPQREQRDLWTAENAEPFWYNPLEEGEEQWRDRIESVIDELLEHVP